MKKITFTLLLILTSIVSQSQNLSMSELIPILGKDVAYTEEFLTNKGWKFRNIENDYYPYFFPKHPRMWFDYLRDIYDSDKAFSFLFCVLDTNSLNVKSLYLQVHSNRKYLEYMKAIKGYGCKLINSSYIDNGFLKVYQGKTKTFFVYILTTKENDSEELSNVWVFGIMSNLTYTIESLRIAFSEFEDEKIDEDEEDDENEN